MTTELPDDVIQALREGRKIDAIKRLRELRALGLADAKAAVEAWDGRDGHGGTTTSELPDEVILALRHGRKIDAIKRLRELRGIGLKAAKEQVDAWEARREGGDARGNVQSPVRRPGQRASGWLKPLAVVAAIGWALVNSVDFAAALIVLANADGYRSGTFTVSEVVYRPDGEGGLIWGFNGRLADNPARYYDPALADGKREGHARLERRFPPGTALEVWANPDVTETLFQGRTLHVLPAAADVRTAERKRVAWWLTYCLLPLVLVVWLARRDDRCGRG